MVKFKAFSQSLSVYHSTMADVDQIEAPQNHNHQKYSVFRNHSLLLMLHASTDNSVLVLNVLVAYETTNSYKIITIKLTQVRRSKGHYFRAKLPKINQ